MKTIAEIIQACLAVRLVDLEEDLTALEKKVSSSPFPAHEWKGTQLRFQQANGKWGAWVDLEGPPGRSGMGSGSQFNLDTLPRARDDEVPDSFVVRVAGQWCLLSFPQMQALWNGDAVTVNGEMITVGGQAVRVLYR